MGSIGCSDITKHTSIGVISDESEYMFRVRYWRTRIKKTTKQTIVTALSLAMRMSSSVQGN